MEHRTDMEELLGLIYAPVFFVQDNTITELNEAASKLFLRKGIPISTILASGISNYRSFSGGVLYLTLLIHEKKWGATVTRLNETDIFVLDQLIENKELRVLALAAKELRTPLANAILAAQGSGDTNSGLNHSLSQLLRIVSNMSDASGCSPICHMESRYVDALFRECAEKAAAYALSCNITIHYSGLEQDTLCTVDWQQLERAALNMLSNAMKFSPADSTIQVQLKSCGNQLLFSVTDCGKGIAEEIKQSLFQRYLREPAIEDGRCGIGLGMLLIRNAAAAHAGSVLIDSPAGGGTRVTLSISAVPPEELLLRNNRLYVDYSGEIDHTLLELSDCLPCDLY